MSKLKDRYLARRNGNIINVGDPSGWQQAMKSVDPDSHKIKVMDDLGTAAYSEELPRVQQYKAREAYNMLTGLLEDIGLNADRRYTVNEISRLKDAIEWALGGGQ